MKLTEDKLRDILSRASAFSRSGGDYVYHYDISFVNKEGRSAVMFAYDHHHEYVCDVEVYDGDYHKITLEGDKELFSVIEEAYDQYQKGMNVKKEAEYKAIYDLL